MGKGSFPEPIAGLLMEALRAQGLAHLLPEAKMREQWKDVVGEKVASIAELDSFKDFVLCIRVVDAVWRNELQYQCETIRRRANEILGGNVVKDVRLR
jgi:predicted nucleic acid-binding Zn ribbon protein